MDELSAFLACRDWPLALAESWRARGIARASDPGALGWTPLQRRAWSAGLERPDSGSWLVSAPTSAGKSLVAEVATLGHLLRGEKVIWLTSTRALAQATWRELAADLAPLGIRPVLTGLDTGAGPGDDPQQFELLVAVYEKMNDWLTRHPHGLAQVGLLVCDELGLLRDAERGPGLDLLLTLVRQGAYSPRLLGLVPPLADAPRLAGWLGARLIAADERPRPLRVGVFEPARGVYRWREQPGGAEGEEMLSPTGADLAAQPAALAEAVIEFLPHGPGAPGMAATLATAATLALAGEPTIVFAPSRARARQWAAALAETLRGALSAPEDAAAQARRLAEREPLHDHELLAAMLTAGIAMHHADLSPAARELVESALAAGGLPLLVATPTLAQGVNTPARNVVQWPQIGGAGGAGGAGAWPERPLERWRHADQAGRAGRLGWGQAPGRSLLVATDPRQARFLWQHYIIEEPEPLGAPLAQAPLERAVLRTLAGEVARRPDNVAALLGASWSAAGDPDFADRVRRALPAELQRLQSLGLLRRTAAGTPLRLSADGQACAAWGLEAEAWVRLRRRALDPAPPDPERPLEALITLALAAAPGGWPVGDPPGAIAAELVETLRAVFSAVREGAPACDAWPEADLQSWTAESWAAAGATQRLAAWLGPEPTPDVERATGWPAGMLVRAGEAAARVAWAAAGIARSAGRTAGSRELASAWRALALRLPVGAPPGAEALAALRVAGLGREGLRALLADGLDSPEALVEASERLLARRLGDAELASRVRRAAAAAMARARRGAPGSVSARARVVALEPTARSSTPRADDGRAEPAAHLATSIDARDAGGPLSLEIDLQSPALIRVNGAEVRLTPLAFDLLACLAERPGKVTQYDYLVQRIWGDQPPEEQQVHAHRRKLNQALSAWQPPGAQPAVQLVRGIGLCLHLPPECVRLLRGEVA